MTPGHNLQILDAGKLEVTLRRLCRHLIENHRDFSNSAIIGIQPRGVLLSRRIHQLLQEMIPGLSVPYGELDVTFHRDDQRLHQAPLKANATSINFLVEGKKVILVDDVLYTGRTVRAALDAMLAFGRPALVELLVLVDRNRKRELPVEAAYVGVRVDSLDNEKVIVRLREGGFDDSVRIETRIS